MDLRDILKIHLRWLKALPHVTPFHAVKHNDSRAIMKTLTAIGTGFDCASKAEIQLVQILGMPPKRVIDANSCKQMSRIKYTANNGVQMMIFGNKVKLMSVARTHSKQSWFLRLQMMIPKQSVTSVLNLVPSSKPAGFFWNGQKS